MCFPFLMHLRLMLYLPISESTHVTCSCDSHFFLILPESALQNQDISAPMGCGGRGDLLNQSGFLYFQKFYTSKGWAGPTELDRISLFSGILHFQGMRGGATELDRISLFPGILHFQGVKGGPTELDRISLFPRILHFHGVRGGDLLN